MAFLSDISGNGDTDTDSASSNDLWNDFDAGLSVNYANESYHQETDEDGSSETSYDATSFGTDLNVSDMVQSMSEQFESISG